MYAEVAWVLVSSGTQHQPQIILETTFQTTFQNIFPFLMTMSSHKQIICSVIVFWKMLQHFTVELKLLRTLFSIDNIRVEQIGQKDTASTLLTFRDSLLKIGRLFPKAVWFKVTE